MRVVLSLIHTWSGERHRETGKCKGPRRFLAGHPILSRANSTKNSQGIQSSVRESLGKTGHIDVDQAQYVSRCTVRAVRMLIFNHVQTVRLRIRVSEESPADPGARGSASDDRRNRSGRRFLFGASRPVAWASTKWADAWTGRGETVTRGISGLKPEIISRTIRSSRRRAARGPGGENRAGRGERIAKDNA